MVWTRRGDVRIAGTGAVKIGDDKVEQPRLFSTFFRVVAIRHKSVHCPTCCTGYSNRALPLRQGGLHITHKYGAPCVPSRHNGDGTIPGLYFANDHCTAHTTRMQRVHQGTGLRRRQRDEQTARRLWVKHHLHYL